MIWLTWRQFRGAAMMMSAALVLLSGVLALTGPGLADDYSDGLASCATRSDGCENFAQQFAHDHRVTYLAVAAVVLVLPALVGLFWGAPLITRELEAGTHRMVWSQSVTRTRWLAVKLGIVGLAAVVTAGLGSLAVTWWSSPLDKAGVEDLPRLEPLMFGARGIVPIGYAAFAFALGVTVGMIVRRTLPAMAITLAVFVAVQIAMPLLVRPHLLPPTRASVEISEANLDFLGAPQAGGGLDVGVASNSPDPGGWVLSSRLVDPSGGTVHGGTGVSTSSGPCSPQETRPETGPTQCLAEINRLGYRQAITYQPASRFWPFQWIETGIYTGLAFGLAGFCFWRLRRRSP